MALEVLTAPAAEPIGVEHLKAQIRVETDFEAGLIEDAIAAARGQVEAHTGLTLTTRTLRLTLNTFPAGPIVLPAWPVQSITSVQYVDGLGVTQVLASSEYRLVKSRRPWRIAPAFAKVWPVTRADFDAVTIDFVAGYGTTASDLPGDILAALKMIAASRMEHRETVVVGTIASKLPDGADELMNRHIFVAP